MSTPEFKATVRDDLVGIL